MKKINKSLTALLIGAITLTGSQVMAQHNHGDHDHGAAQTKQVSAPHGGQLVKVGKYTIEMKTDLFNPKDKLSFYVYKGRMKVMSVENISGKIEIMYPDHTVISDSLKNNKNKMLVGQLKTTESFGCIVTLKIKGKEVVASFKYKGIGGKSKAANYSCPMHPEVNTKKPGSCPKCGMNLEPEEN